MIEVAAADLKRARGLDRCRAERQRGVDQLGVLPNGPELARRSASRRNQSRGLGRRQLDRNAVVGSSGRSEEADQADRQADEHHDREGDRLNAVLGKAALQAPAGDRKGRHDFVSFFGVLPMWPRTWSRGPSAMIRPASMTISRSRIESMLWRWVATIRV